MNDTTSNGPGETPPYSSDQASQHSPSDLTTPLGDAADDAVRVVSENVGLVVVGGLAIGLLAAALMPRSKKRKLKKRSRKMSAMVSDLSQELVAQAADAASEGRDKLSGLSRSVGATVSDYSSEMSKQASDAAEGAAGKLHDSSKAIARTLVKLIEKARP